MTMFYAKSLKELENLYVADQNSIVEKRESGFFQNKEADIAAQRESWESYIIERYKLSGALKDKKVIVNYYGNILILSYAEQRDSYYSGAVTSVENTGLKMNILKEFEQRLISAGAITAQTDVSIRDSFLLELKKKEDAIKSEKTKVTKSEFATLCKAQMPIATTYIQSFKY